MRTNTKELTFTAQVTMNTYACCVCGVMFALEATYDNKRRQDGKEFYCPNGHNLHYGGSKSKDDEINRLAKTLERAEALYAAEKQAADKLMAERNAAKKELSRIKTRVKNGVCPCCNRTFVDLQRHMKTKHPEAVKETP
jgi:hypothetical protein